MSDALAARAGAGLRRAGLMLAVAESCTGGLIAQRMTALPGSSGWFERGFVCYSNASKEEMLAVPPALIAAHGAVSPEVVLAMAAGALARSRAGIALAVSGVAGPGGGTPAKPVGTVCIAWQRAGSPGQARTFRFDADRDTVRMLAADAALLGLVERLERGNRDG